MKCYNWNDARTMTGHKIYMTPSLSPGLDRATTAIITSLRHNAVKRREKIWIFHLVCTSNSSSSSTPPSFIYLDGIMSLFVCDIRAIFSRWDARAAVIYPFLPFLVNSMTSLFLFSQVLHAVSLLSLIQERVEKIKHKVRERHNNVNHRSADGRITGGCASN